MGRMRCTGSMGQQGGNGIKERVHYPEAWVAYGPSPNILFAVFAAIDVAALAPHSPADVCPCGQVARAPCWCLMMLTWRRQWSGAWCVKGAWRSLPKDVALFHL